MEMLGEMKQEAIEANERLTAALQSLIFAAHGMRVPVDRAHASEIGRLEVWAGKIESMAKVIEDETLYIREAR